MAGAAKPTRTCTRIAFAALSALCACASQPRGPFFGDEKYLVFGVDPNSEAKALIRDLEAQGYQAEPRLRGEHFTALGVIHPDSTHAGVRVVTVRGIALALDHVQPSIFIEEVHYRLLPPPHPDTHDADGDGFDEVFVQVIHGSGAASRSCIAIYRVRDSGFVDPVDGRKFSMSKPPLGREALWQAPSFCELEPTEQPDAETPDAGTPSPGAKPTTGAR